MEGTKEGHAGGRVPLLLRGGCFVQKIFPLSPIAHFSGCWEKRAAGGTFLSKLPTGEKIHKEGTDSHDQSALRLGMTGLYLW